MSIVRSARGSFLGASGCGKSTLLRIVAGLDTCDSGSIVRDGVDIGTLAPAKRDCAMVFQSYALFPNLTAAENIAFAFAGRRIDKKEASRLVGDALAMVGLGDVGHRYPDELSGGMQQRVSLARALVIRPRLLLLDEPLSALDAKVRTSLRSELRLLQQELDITTIMVTHDQDEALSMSDRVALMHNGRIEQCGPPAELYTHPASLFAAGFIGSGNRLPGELFGRNGFEAFVRPERTRFTLGENGNGISAQIETVEFCGATCRVTCHVEARDLSKRVLLDCPAEIAVVQGFVRGAQGTVTFDSDAVTFFAGGIDAHS